MKALHCDVLVVGGGAAGVAAAAAAARAGARVILLEHYGFLGGLATAGLVGTICGLYLRDSAADQAALVSSGFLREFSERLASLSGAAPIRLKDGLWVLPLPEWAFAEAAHGFLGEVKGLRLILHATVAEVMTDGANIRQVHALAWNQRLAVQPKCVVDCSGEATVTALAGGGVTNRSDDQAPALVFVLDNADPQLAERGLLDVFRQVRRAVNQGQLPPGADRFSLIPGSARAARVAFKLNLPPDARGAQRPAWRQVTVWERTGRALARQIQRFLAENTNAFRHAHLSHVAPQLGVRTGRRIRGTATLRDADVRAGRKCPDGIARGCWPIESWQDAPRPEMVFFAERDYYEIPFGCLRPTGLDNVLAAGRCLSAEPGALAAARVIGTALATGWAAGSAAAFHAAGKPMAAAVPTIRKQLAS